jgi:hypothetical protein
MKQNAEEISDEKVRKSVMFDPHAQGRLKAIAAHRGLSIEDAVRRYLNPVIDREYQKVLSEAELGGEGG